MEAGRRALDISMRAIDAYKKTLLVDKVTSDDDKSPPVYILDEISSILMSCPLHLTKEIVEYTFRRLRHRSPQVKCKVLRFIKYTINKAGSSGYRRELQSCSMAIRELFNYQGPVDPLRGNALNQAVRDAAEEAFKAIFSSDASVKRKNIRIEGFGSGSFSTPLTTLYRSLVKDSLDHHNDVHSIHYSIDTGSFDSPFGKQDDREGESFLYCNGSVRFDSRDSKLEYGKAGLTLDGEPPRQSQERNIYTQGKEVVSSEDRLVNHVTAPNGSRDKSCFKTEADNEGHICAGPLKAPHALKPEYKVVDLLSFDDPFDGMHVYGSNESAAITVEDLLSDGCISAQPDAYFKNGPITQNPSLSSIGSCSLAVQERGHKTNMSDLNTVLDFTANMWTLPEKCGASCVNNKTSGAQSKGYVLRPLNHTAVCMHPQEAIGGSLHTSSLI